MAANLFGTSRRQLSIIYSGVMIAFLAVLIIGVHETMEWAITSEQARELIDAVKAEHPQARHNCSAYLIDPPDAAPLQHSSDDGEPSGTAGTPMLEALRASDTWNATAVVTRYFGGILLGGGGLVRAYSTSVSEAVARAPIAYLVGRDVLETQLNPADAGRIEAELRARGAAVIDTIWGADVTLRIAIDPGDRDSIDACLAQASSGVAKFRYVETRRIELDEAPSVG